MATARTRQVTLKIERAKKHANELKALFQDFKDSQPFKVDFRVNATTGQGEYFLRVVEAVPDALTVVLGDVLQNLRTALEHLAYQLVDKDTNGNLPNVRDIGFPIADDKAAYDRCKIRALNGAAAGSVQAIDALAPYPGGNDALWTLHRLNNVEKHRLLLTVGGSHTGIDFIGLIARSMPSSFSEAFAGRSLFLKPANNLFPLKVGHVLASVPPGYPVNPSTQFACEVLVVESGVVSGEPLLTLVDRVTAAVQTAFDQIEPLLS